MSIRTKILRENFMFYSETSLKYQRGDTLDSQFAIVVSVLQNNHQTYRGMIMIELLDEIRILLSLSLNTINVSLA